MKLKSHSRSHHSGKDTIDVWIVEDNSLFRKNIAALINGEKGMTCTGEFSSCEEVLHQLETERSPDIFLLDIGLPGMNGITGVKKIKAIDPLAQIVMITVFDDDDHIFDAICAGAMGYILKTTTEKTILQSIRDVVNGGSPMNASIARKVLKVFTTFRMPKEEFNLSPREKEILDFIIQSNTNQQIAEKLFISKHTVNTHLRNIYEKLQVHSRAELVSKVLRQQ